MCSTQLVGGPSPSFVFHVRLFYDQLWPKGNGQKGRKETIILSRVSMLLNILVEKLFSVLSVSGSIQLLLVSTYIVCERLSVMQSFPEVVETD